MPHTCTTHPHKPGDPIGHTFIELQSVDSTNNYAMAHVHAGLAFPGTVFFAHEQFAGKGQRGKTWVATPGENIMMSVVLQPRFLSIDRQFALSACISLACYDFLLQQGLHHASIKWPNDLYWRDRKAGGILIENILQGSDWQYAIAGIGLNINQTTFTGHLRNGVSLSQVTGKLFEPVSLAKSLCAFVDKRYHQLEHEDFGKMLEEYNAALYKRDLPVLLRQGDRVFETIVQRVDASGQLYTKDTIERTFNFGDIEWLRNDNTGNLSGYQP